MQILSTRALTGAMHNIQNLPSGHNVAITTLQLYITQHQKYKTSPNSTRGTLHTLSLHGAMLIKADTTSHNTHTRKPVCTEMSALLIRLVRAGTTRLQQLQCGHHEQHSTEEQPSTELTSSQCQSSVSNNSPDAALQICAVSSVLKTTTKTLSEEKTAFQHPSVSE